MRISKKKPQIKYVEWGFANNFGSYIEINKNLKKYPKLHKYVLAHELNHKKEFDLAHEFEVDLRIVLRLILFSLRYPRTLIDLLPIQIRKGKLIYDLNTIILYLIIGILIFFSIVLWL